MQKALLVMLLVLCFTTHSSATVTFQSSLECRKSSEQTSPPEISYGDAGAFNYGNNPLLVTCPIIWRGISSTISSVDVTTITYMDGASGSLLTQSLWCYAVTQDTYGNTFGGPTKHSCSTAGGCGTSTSYASGFTNTLSLNGVDPVPGDLGWVSYALNCQIPVRSNLFGYKTSY